VGLILILTLFACSGGSATEPTKVPVVPDTGGEVLEPEATMEVRPTEEPKPTEGAPSFNQDVCSLLEPADIEAAALDEFPVGDPHPGNDTPLFLGEANSCAWEFGNPNAQYHERLYLYVFKLGANEDPESAFDGQARRMSGAREPSMTIGDRAMYAEDFSSLLVLDEDFLFYLRADKLSPTEEIEGKVIELAKLVIARK
jgi:hypothetical protein